MFNSETAGGKWFSMTSAWDEWSMYFDMIVFVPMRIYPRPLRMCCAFIFQCCVWNRLFHEKKKFWGRCI